MLNKQKGNMYGFITHTWNTIKGKCYHDCSYCYMKRFKNQKEVRFDEKELNTDLGENNFIFVGSSCDMFAENIKYEWIEKTLLHCQKHNKNKYLFQTKNPKNFWNKIYPHNSIICITIESNRDSKISIAPEINERIEYFKQLPDNYFLGKMITIEPIMDFDINQLLQICVYIKPFQVNIGADSGRNNLPEPSKEKILELVTCLKSFTNVFLKDNLNRIIK